MANTEFSLIGRRVDLSLVTDKDVRDVLVSAVVDGLLVCQIDAVGTVWFPLANIASITSRDSMTTDAASILQ